MGTASATTQTTQIRSVRIGRLQRRPPQARARGPWPGDLAVGQWYEAPALPAWINGDPWPRALKRLLFAESTVLALGIAYALMSLG